MKTPEMGGIPPEKNKQWRERISDILINMRDLSFIKNSSIELSEDDLSMWHQIVEVISQKVLSDQTEFLSAIKEELNNRQWVNDKLPSMIVEKIADGIDFLEWKDKNRK